MAIGELIMGQAGYAFQVLSPFQEKRMKTSFHVSAVLVLAFGAAALFAQEKGKKEPTGVDKVAEAVHKECCKAEKCEGEQKKTCDHVAETVKAGMAKCGEKFKKEGMKCDDCAKAKDGGPCEMCREMVVKVVAPWIKTQAEAKDPTHTVTKGDKKETV